MRRASQEVAPLGGSLHPIWATPWGSDAPRIVLGSGRDRLCTPSGRPRLDIAIERNTWAIGPIQLVVVGFEHPDFQGRTIAELERLRENDTVRVIDALAVHKDVAGGIEGRAPQQLLRVTQVP